MGARLFKEPSGLSFLCESVPPFSNSYSVGIASFSILKYQYLHNFLLPYTLWSKIPTIFEVTYVRCYYIFII